MFLQASHPGEDDHGNNLSEKLLSSHAQDDEQEQPPTTPLYFGQGHHQQQQQPPFALRDGAHAVISIPDQSPSFRSSSAGTGDVDPGSKQPDRYRDLIFLVLFVAHLGVVLYEGLSLGLSSLNYAAGSGSVVLHFGGMFLILLGGVGVSLLQTSVMATLLIRFARQVIPLMLLSAVALSLVAAITFLSNKYYMGAVLGFGVAAWSALYAKSIWNRIPLATATLETALAAIQSNAGISLVACGMVLASLVFQLLWMLAWIGAFAGGFASTCTSSGYGDAAEITCDYSQVSAVKVALMLLSFAWTTQVISNCLHVTVSGVVGTWWFAPDLAATWWSPAIQDSWARSVTYSLGSVCLGSLLVSALQVSHSMLVWLKRSSSPCGSRNLSFVACVAEFLLSFVGRLVSYFNKYAFVYIGLYGYDFLESGHRAFELFQQRGWTTVIQDDLIGRVLHLASVVVGLCTAAVAIVLIVAHPSSTYDGGAWAGLFWSFLLCLLVGTVVSRMILGVVMSACDTVLVCFAEAPRELEQNHPGIHRSLIQAWQQVYPEDRNAGYVL